MFETITPEQAGISSKYVQKLLAVLTKKNYAMHSIIIAHKEKIFFEKYWEPYDENSLQRIYSAGKSFVSLAIGFLCDEGKIGLDDKIVKFFPKYDKDNLSEYLREQTVRDMLTMSTASLDEHWMKLGIKDRTEYYFTRPQNRPASTIYNYDSTGSYLLGVIVEHVSGKNFIEYLRGKLFDKIGVSQEIECLKTPEGYLWADSGIRCTARDFLYVAQFAANRGQWRGEQLLSCEYMEKATTKQVFNACDGFGGSTRYGYGYQFWITQDNGFSFNGMGNQFAICMPDLELVFVCTADNQFCAASQEVIFDAFFDLIAENISPHPMKTDASSYQSLLEYSHSLKLATAPGEEYSAYENAVNNVEFILHDNPMKIKRIKLCFEENREGYLLFENDCGKKKLTFGMKKNVFSLFPKDDMPDETGAVNTPGNQYRCATSAAWVEERKLFIKSQIIDKYLGNLNITIGFKNNRVGIHMIGNAEYFLADYNGFAGGYKNA